jgi:hypothetical protein
VLENEVTVYHHGTTETTVTNQAGPPFQWKAGFSVASQDRTPLVMVDGVAAPAKVEQRANHQLVAVVTVLAPPGQTRTARYTAAKP